MLGSLLESLKGLFSRKDDDAPELHWDFGSGRISETVTRREEIDGPGGPVTAREAFELAQHLATGYDHQARLYMVASGGKLDSKGRSTQWEFKYQFPNRWARSVFTVSTSASETDPRPAEEFLEVAVIPFPPPGSAMARMLSEGQEGFVEQQWQMELDRKSPLPVSFKDSSEALELWLKEGFDPGTLGRSARLEATTLPQGGAVWRLSDPESGQKSIRETSLG